MSEHKDQIYKTAITAPEKFRFDRRVAVVFEDMISRSVPGYRQILEMLPTLVRYKQALRGNYYDLGCSLGAGMLAMAEGHNKSPRTIIGVDNSAAMLEQAESNLAAYTAKPAINFQLACEDLLTYSLQNAALTLMNFTLQFIALEQRDEILQNIFNSSVEGGMLVLSEKIKFEQPATNRALIDIHHQYKADQGYSQLEIAQKRDAIDEVLIPETLDTHLNRLRKVGYSVVTPWVQNLQFVSILAIK